MKLPVDIVKGVEGLALCIANIRLCGPKPWGGGKVLHHWDVDLEDLKDAIAEWEQRQMEDSRNALGASCRGPEAV